MLRFFLAFLALLAILFVAELTPPVQQWVVLPWTAALARLSATAVQWFDPQVISYGKVLQDAATGRGVSIEAGCNGVEAFIVLLAAVSAYPASWSTRLWGIAWGFLAIQTVNLLRIVTLFYLAAWKPAVFEFAHLYLWQALIMLDVLVVWLVWLRWATRREYPTKAQGSAASAVYP